MTFNKSHWIFFMCFVFASVQSTFGQDSSLDSLLKRLPIEANDSIKAEVLAQIGDLYYEVNFDSMVHYYNEAILLSKEIPYAAIEFSSWRSLGYVYSNRKNDFDTSLVFFNKALELIAAQLDSVAIAYVLSDIGRIYWKQGSPYEALEYHLQVRAIGEKLNSPKVLLRANISLGVLENENGNNNKAKEYYNAALLLADTLNKVRSKGQIFNNLGKAYRDDKDYPNALNSFNKADTIFTSLNDNDNLTLVNYNIGMTLTLQGFPEAGIEYYELASRINEKIENKEIEVAIQIGLSNAYQKLNKSNQAIRIAENALTLLKEINTDSTYYEMLYKVLGESYESIGNHAQSLAWYKKYIKFKADQNKVEETKKIASLIHLYDLQKKENKILELKTVNLEKDKELEISSSNLSLMIFAFFTLLSFSFLAFYVNKLREFKKFDHLKSKLSNDLHDNIGASLNHIKMLSSRMKKDYVNTSEKEDIITKIKTISDELMYNMHDMVWSLDKKKETIGNLLERIQDHADVFLGDFNIPYEIKMETPNQNILLNTEKKVNIYLIFKESLNNILKHTETEKVLISFYNKNTQHLKISISSFYSVKKEDEKLSTHQGIRNMKKRAKSIGGKLSIIDNPGNFIVEFSFK